MARRYIVITRIDKHNALFLELIEKTYYKYYGDLNYCFNRSVILDKSHTKILKGFLEIYNHGFKSLKNALEYLLGTQSSDQNFTDHGLYDKTSTILSFYFAPRHG